MSDQSTPGQRAISPELLRAMAAAVGVSLTSDSAARLIPQAEQHFAQLSDLDAIAKLGTEPAAEFHLDRWTRPDSEGDLITGDEADPQLLAALIPFSGPFNLTGFPAVSIPCGFTASGLPVGMQLVAKPWQEGPLLAAEHAYEQATDWHRRLPLLLQT